MWRKPHYFMTNHPAGRWVSCLSSGRGTMEVTAGSLPGSLNWKRSHSLMLLILVALLVVMSLAGLVAAYVAYPERGEPIPHAAWLSDKLSKLHDRIEP